MQVNMFEAKRQLSKLVQAAEGGEDVIIARNGVPVARLLPFGQPSGLKGWGRLKSLGAIDDAFTVETETEISRLLEGGR